MRTLTLRRHLVVAIVALQLAVLSASSRTRFQGAAGHPVAVIGIASEIAPVESRIQGASVARIQGVVFTSGVIDGAPVVAARSGAGKVNAAFAATLLLDHFSPAAIVWTGTAGAIDTELNPGDVVIGTAVGYHDFGSMTADGFVRSPTRDASSGRSDPAFFPANSKLLTAARRAAAMVKPTGPEDENSHPKIREGLIVTGDAFLSNPTQRQELRRQLNATAVEMEGAAVAQVGARFGVPVLVIRSITDRADGGASNSYRRFVDLASRNAGDLALATVREFLK
jgi:adenosylhomocysteine nucleosidase